MDIKEIQQYLPHRYPFLLVDRVEKLNLGESITAIKNVSINEPFFQGHFPQVSIMPGMLIVEAMAQACGILGFKTLDKTPADGSIYLFVGADNIRFKRQVVPGDQLVLKVDMCLIVVVSGNLKATVMWMVILPLRLILCVPTNRFNIARINSIKIGRFGFDRFSSNC